MIKAPINASVDTAGIKHSLITPLTAILMRQDSSDALIASLGADLNSRLENGETSRDLAFRYPPKYDELIFKEKGSLDKAELLLKYGADLNSVDDQYQSSPMDLAARWGHSEIVELLLDCRSDPKKLRAEWSTPLAWAKKKGQDEIEERLKKWGATS